MEDIWLSKSSIKIYLQCPYKWKKLYINGIKEEKSPVMERGINIHKQIEMFYDNVNLEGKDDNNIPQIRLYEMMKDNIEDMRNFLNFEQERIKYCVINNIFNKKYFFPYLKEKKIMNDNLKLKGIIDAVFINPKDNKAIIIDWKTGRYDKNMIDEWRMELSIYKILLDSSGLIHDKVKYWGMYFIDVDKLFFEEINNNIINNTLKLIEEVREEIREEKFNCKTNNYCQNCQFVTSCPRFKVYDI